MQGNSRYALKIQGKVETVVQYRRPKRRCTHCNVLLHGKRGHGFPGLDGKGVFCPTHAKGVVGNEA